MALPLAMIRQVSDAEGLLEISFVPEQGRTRRAVLVAGDKSAQVELVPSQEIVEVIVR